MPSSERKLETIHFCSRQHTFDLRFGSQFQVLMMKINIPFRLALKSSRISTPSHSDSPPESPLSPLRSSNIGEQSPYQPRSQAINGMRPNVSSPIQSRLLSVESEISSSDHASDQARAPSKFRSNVSSMMKSIFKTFKDQSRSQVGEASENTEVSVMAEASSSALSPSPALPASPHSSPLVSHQHSGIAVRNASEVLNAPTPTSHHAHETESNANIEHDTGVADPVSRVMRSLPLRRAVSALRTHFSSAANDEYYHVETMRVIRTTWSDVLRSRKRCRDNYKLLGRVELLLSGDTVRSERGILLGEVGQQHHCMIRETDKHHVFFVLVDSKTATMYLRLVEKVHIGHPQLGKFLKKWGISDEMPSFD